MSTAASEASHFSHTDKAVISDVQHHDYSSAQKEINDYRHENGNGALSASDTEKFNNSLADHGFPNLEVASGPNNDAFIVSKNGAQAETTIASTLTGHTTDSNAISSANQTLSTLQKSDGGDANLFKNEVQFINENLLANNLPQFQFDQSTNSWTIEAPAPPAQPATPVDSTPAAAAAPLESAPASYSAPESTGGSSSGGGSDYSSGSSSGAGEVPQISQSALASLGNNPTGQQWATELINILNAPPYNLNIPLSAANIQFFEAWQKAEGGGWGASDGDAAYNPFNTTQNENGATSINSVGVKSYASLQDGLTATAQSLTNGNHGNIISALQNGSSAMADAQAVASSPWGTGSLVEKVLSG